MSKEVESKIFNAIVEYISIYQYPPSFREILKMTGLSSTSTIHYYVNKMIENGILESDANMTPRALRVPGYQFVKMDDYLKTEMDNHDLSADIVSKPIISNKIFDRAKEIITSSDYTPTIYLSGQNSIHLRYETDTKRYLDFEVFGDYISYLVVFPDDFKKSVFGIARNIDSEKAHSFIEMIYTISESNI